MCAVVTSWLMKLIIIVQIVVIDGNIQASTTKLVIKSPESLSNLEGLDHRDTLFGNPPYGSKLECPSVYADITCSNGRMSSSQTYPPISRRYYNEQSATSYIFLISRDSCPLNEKMRWFQQQQQQQQLPVAAILIADDLCLCSDTDCMANNVGPCHTQAPDLSYNTIAKFNNGSNNNGVKNEITFPGMLISKKDGDKMKQYLKQFSSQEQYKDVELMVELTYKLPYNDNIDTNNNVILDFWTQPKNKFALDFVTGNFGLVAAAFGDKMQFTPHEYILSGLKMNCLGKDGNILCHNQCTNNGRYCAPYHTSNTNNEGIINNNNEEVTGAQVVAESLRRMCIWETYGKQDGIGYEWWLYVKEFESNCGLSDSQFLFSSVDCIENCYGKAGIDGTYISLCMYKSGGLIGDNDNKLLEQALAEKMEFSATVAPSVFVNHARIFGELSDTNILRATCAGLQGDNAPSFCRACNTDSKPNKVNCVMEEYKDITSLTKYLSHKDIEVDTEGDMSKYLLGESNNKPGDIGNAYTKKEEVNEAAQQPESNAHQKIETQSKEVAAVTIDESASGSNFFMNSIKGILVIVLVIGALFWAYKQSFSLPLKNQVQQYETVELTEGHN